MGVLGARSLCLDGDLAPYCTGTLAKSVPHVCILHRMNEFEPTLRDRLARNAF